MFLRLLCIVLLAVSLSGLRASSPEHIKLLTIGNSFAWNATEFLPDLARAAGKSVDICPVNLSSRSLEQHASYLRANEANPDDPAGKPYTNFRSPGREKMSFKEALQSEKWDVVTIQQASSLSFQANTYEPYATELIAAVRKYAPSARILVFETWAYREDHKAFSNGTFSQQAMHEQLVAAYRKVAETHGLSLIPVGEAFGAARKDARWTFQFPDADFDYVDPSKGRVPKQPGSLNAGWVWEKNDAGQEELRLDAIHANTAGKYLAAATFFEMLFGADVTPVSFAPVDLNAEDASRLRTIAHEAIAEDSRRRSTAGP